MLSWLLPVIIFEGKFFQTGAWRKQVKVSLDRYLATQS
jgi:hypothetical protein